MSRPDRFIKAYNKRKPRQTTDDSRDQQWPRHKKIKVKKKEKKKTTTEETTQCQKEIGQVKNFEWNSSEAHRQQQQQKQNDNDENEKNSAKISRLLACATAKYPVPCTEMQLNFEISEKTKKINS